LIPSLPLSSKASIAFPQRLSVGLWINNELANKHNARIAAVKENGAVHTEWLEPDG
jgi:hypothetical protein